MPLNLPDNANVGDPGHRDDHNLIVNAITALDGNKAENSLVVHNTTDETVQGTKTFTHNPVVPAPSSNMHPATKQYVDDGLATKASTSHTHTATASNVINVLDNGVKADCKRVTVNVTSGGYALVVTASPYTEGTAVFNAVTDVGKTIHIDKAGAGGGWLKTTIASVTSTSSVTLTNQVQTTATGTNAIFGTNNTSAINTIISSAPEYSTIKFPAAKYMYYTDGGHVISKNNIAIVGEETRPLIVSTQDSGYVFKFTGLYYYSAFISLIHAAAWTFPYVWATNMRSTQTYIASALPTYPTSAVGILFEKSTDGWFGAELHEVNVSYFFDNFKSYRGQGITLHKCIAWNAVNANINLRNIADTDSTTFKVLHCVVGSDTAEYVGGSIYGILLHSFGGAWVIDNHIWHGRYGICFDVKNDAAKGFSSNMKCSLNSIEDIDGYLYNPIEGGADTTRIGGSAGIKFYIAADMWASGGVVNTNTINSTSNQSPISINGLAASGRTGTTALRRTTFVGNVSNVTSGYFVNASGAPLGDVSIAFNNGGGSGEYNIPSGSGVKLGPATTTT